MGTEEILLSVMVPVLIALGTFLVSGKLTGEYLWARVCFIAALLDLYGILVYRLWSSTSSVRLGALGSVVVAIIETWLLILLFKWVDDREASGTNRLIAGDSPTPNLPQNVPTNARMIVFLGSNVAWQATRMPMTIVQMASEKMLTIDWRKNGRELVVTILKVFDDRNNIIARIENGSFWTDPSARMKRPDRHSLIVYDHNDKEVLSICFLNPTALTIRCFLRHSGVRSPVEVTADYMNTGFIRVSNSSMGEIGGAIINV